MRRYFPQMEPGRGLEPLTTRLQGGCAASCATSAVRLPVLEVSLRRLLDSATPVRTAGRGDSGGLGERQYDRGGLGDRQVVGGNGRRARAAHDELDDARPVAHVLEGPEGLLHE